MSTCDLGYISCLDSPFQEDTTFDSMQVRLLDPSAMDEKGLDGFHVPHSDFVIRPEYYEGRLSADLLCGNYTSRVEFSAP